MDEGEYHLIDRELSECHPRRPKRDADWHENGDTVLVNGVEWFKCPDCGREEEV